MAHREDPDLVGLDQEKMQALIGELRAAQQVITTFAGEFSAPLSARGISVNTVHQAEHWAADQVSKLTQRLEKLREAEHALSPETPAQHTGTAPAPHAAAPAPQVTTPAPHAATLDAKRISHAAKHGQALPERVWDDIERHASDRQYAAAFFAAAGAAGLALLGASIARSRNYSKDKQEADRRQALLDELLGSAGYAAPPPSLPASPPAARPAARPAAWRAAQDPGDAPHAGSAHDSDLGSDDAPDTEGHAARPRLRLVKGG